MKGVDFTFFLIDCLQMCEHNGLKPPYMLVAVGANSEMLVLRDQCDESPDFLHGPDQKMELPINVMIVDSEGKSIHTRLNGNGSVAA